MGDWYDALGSPVIETARTRMRPHRLSDFEASAAMWADPEVVRFITGKPSTREESWRRLNRHVGHWCLLGYGFWVVEEKDTGAFLGEVGFADFKRTIQPPLDGMPEIGWALPNSAQGRGIATETVAAAVTWGRRPSRAGIHSLHRRPRPCGVPEVGGEARIPRVRECRLQWQPHPAAAAPAAWRYEALRAND